VKCREEARAEGLDYAEACQETFKAFLQCCFNNVDYYEPFLESMGIAQDALQDSKEEEPEEVKKA
jgi:hypothetical protein